MVPVILYLLSLFGGAVISVLPGARKPFEGQFSYISSRVQRGEKMPIVGYYFALVATVVYGFLFVFFYSLKSFPFHIAVVLAVVWGAVLKHALSCLGIVLRGSSASSG